MKLLTPHPRSCFTSNGPSYLRHAGGVLPARPVSPAIRVHTRSFLLAPASPQMSARKRRDAGAYSATAGPATAPGDPRGPPREPCGSHGPHGPGVAFRHPRSAILGPVRVSAPPLLHRSTRQDHCGHALFASRDRRVPDDIAAARHGGDRTPRPPGSWPPTGLPSRRRPLPRQVLDPNAPSSSGVRIMRSAAKAGISATAVNAPTATARPTGPALAARSGPSRACSSHLAWQATSTGSGLVAMRALGGVS
jgi:hypothetical protein